VLYLELTECNIQITLNEFPVPFGYAIPAILANRLLISVRANYYKEVLDISYMTSLYSNHSGYTHSTARSTNYVLDTVDE
jgi:hypothetical protein